MKSRILTLQQLIDANACQSQVDQFRADFGASVRVTVAMAKKNAMRYDFNWAQKLLSPIARANYDNKLAPLDDEALAYMRANIPDCAWDEDNGELDFGNKP